MATRQAAILVGGKGVRLGALTRDTPKPLMALSEGRVFLDLLIEQAARHGFDEIVLLAGHLGQQFVDRYAGRAVLGAKLKVTLEPSPAGTAGALAHARDLLAETFLLLNGDTFFDFNFKRLDALLTTHRDALGALALRRTDDTARYGSARMEGLRIAAFREKAARDAPAAGLVNAGAARLRRGVLDFIRRLPSSIEFDVYPRLAAEGRLLGEEFPGYFLDIGLPETLALARRDLPLIRAALFVDACVDALDAPTAKLIARANDAGWLVFLFADGAYAPSALLEEHGAHVDAALPAAATAEAFRTTIAAWGANAAQSLLLSRDAALIAAARHAGVAPMSDGETPFADLRPAARPRSPEEDLRAPRAAI